MLVIIWYASLSALWVPKFIEVFFLEMQTAFNSLTTHFVSFKLNTVMYVGCRAGAIRYEFSYSIRDSCSGEVLTSRYHLVWEGRKGMWMVGWPCVGN